MPAHPHHLQASSARLLLGGLLVAGILCLLAAWTLTSKVEYTASHGERNGTSVSLEMPLHVTAEHSRALKRLFKRPSNHFTSLDLPTSVWALIASEFCLLPSPLLVAFVQTVTSSPRVNLQQLQTLDSPRAPPFA